MNVSSVVAVVKLPLPFAVLPYFYSQSSTAKVSYLLEDEENVMRCQNRAGSRYAFNVLIMALTKLCGV